MPKRGPFLAIVKISARHIFATEFMLFITKESVTFTLMLTLIAFMCGCSPKTNKPGSPAYLDFKNGIGGLSFGQDVEEYKEQGFVLENRFDSQDNREEAGPITDYRNASFHVTFGDFYLEDIRLTFVSNKLVSICGLVGTANTTDNGNELSSDLISYLIVLFGKPTSEDNLDTVEHLVDYTAVHKHTAFWDGKRIRLTVQEDSTKTWELASLTIEEFRTLQNIRESMRAEADRERRKAEKAESDRMLKQKF
jgi:hypothetical protein